MKTTEINENEWHYFEERERVGGLALRAVRHMEHLLFPYVSVPGIWVGSATGDPPRAPVTVKKPRPLTLGSPEMPERRDLEASAIAVPTVTGLVRPFVPLVGSSATFRTQGSVLADGETEPLQIEQRWMFCPYSIDPPHEPGALAWASRFYPIVSFRYPKSKASAPPVNYIRVDLRMEVAVEAATNLESGGKGNIPPQAIAGSFGVNQAGLFTDAEGGNNPTAEVSTELTDIFLRLEKPLHYEVLGVGLDWDSPAGDSRGDWDNIHQWPKDEGLPATPGATHAAHMHWRWGFAASRKTYSTQHTPVIGPIPSIPFRVLLTPAGGPQFTGFRGPSSPLIDPRLPLQRMVIAVTRYDTTHQTAEPEEWAPSGKKPPTTERFSDLFINARKLKLPEPIEQGTALTWWLSAEAFRAPSHDPWEGSFFAHGMFFTHSSTPFKLKIGGSINRGSDKGSTKRQTWWRPQDPKAKL